jgi:hypothetical protein
MEPFEWEPEYYDGGEDYPEEWGDPEAFPGFPGRRLSPGSALARRFYPQRRRPTPARPAGRLVGVGSATTPAAAIRQLEDRQQSIAAQLAQYQQRIAAQQSSDQFGPMATGAVGALALGFKSNDLFAPAIVNGLPLAQLLLQSRGRAISSGFMANPLATLAFPAAALLLTVFRDKIPGLAQTVVARPETDFFKESDGTFLVSAKGPSGTLIKFRGPSVTDPGEPTAESETQSGPVSVRPGETIKFRAFLDKVGSEVVSFKAPARAVPSPVTGPVGGGVINPNP